MAEQQCKVPTINLEQECQAPEVGTEPDVESGDECPDQDNVLEEQLKERLDTPHLVNRSLSDPGLLAKIKSWTNEIFAGVTKTPPLGRPGHFYIYGENAVPLFAHRNQVLMAASEVGSGRLVVLSTEALARGIRGKALDDIDTARLHSNMRSWLVRSTDPKIPIKVNILGTCKDLNALNKKTTIVLCMSNFSNALNRRDEILGFVRDGGAFLLAFRPWFWHQRVKNDAELAAIETQMADFLEPVGIALGREMIFGGQGFHIPFKEEGETPLSVYDDLLATHMGNFLECCCQDDMTNMTAHAVTMETLLTKLPPFAHKALTDKIQTVFEHCSDHIKDCKPSQQNKVEAEDKRGAMAMCNKMSLRGCGYSKAPGIGKFPGDILESQSLQECVDIYITSQKPRFHSTGYYLPAGVELRVTAEECTGAEKDWLLRIGAHSDRLYKKTALSRWPEVVMTTPISGEQLTIRSPFGGLLYLKSPPGKSAIKLQISNVVEAPYFDLKSERCADNWKVGRKAPAPWADIEGKYVRFTLPAACVRAVQGDDLAKIMTEWDKVIASNHDLRGTDVTKHRGEWVVADIQISAGAMHSGYPIMGHLAMTRGDNFILSYDRLTTSGFWGAFHELGHNMQRGAWTITGTREVTCNIFTLHAMEVVSGIPLAQHPRVTDEKALKKYETFLLSKTTLCEVEKQPFTTLGFYIQLVLTFGWDAFKRAFREYETLTPQETPKKNPAKIDKWLVVFSRAVKVSIAPMMELWKLGASKKAAEEVEGLKPFLPDDMITRRVPERVGEIVRAYPGLIREL